MSERIQPENNRTFTAGSGNWAGDLVWHGDTFLGHQGYITLDLDSSPLSKQISLHYPAIKPVPNKDNTLNFWMVELASSGNLITMDYEITDGVHSFGPYHVEMFGILDWAAFGNVETLPPDWDTKNSTLLITLSATEGPLGEIAFDDFSLEAIAPTKIQYLPIMGVG